MILQRVKSASIVAVATFVLAGMAWAPTRAKAAKKSGVDSSVSSLLPPVAYFSKQEVDANFEHHKGMDESIYDSDYGAKNFKVKTSNRKTAVRAEVHMTYTDVLYVVKGSATLVTGGKLVDIVTPATYPNGQPFSKNEMWGKSIAGGESRHVSAGDVIVIPNGVPHWFSKIDDPPFWFFNVKVQ